MHENRETSETPAAQPGSRTAGEGSGHTARMYVPEESHSGILPMNQSNKDRRPSAENEEERPLIKENAGQPTGRSQHDGDTRMKVFFSHSSKHKPLVREVIHYL